MRSPLQRLVLGMCRRSGHRYECTLEFTHAELAELGGQTRVTVTRQLSKWRDTGLIQQDSGPERTLRIAPLLVEA